MLPPAVVAEVVVVPESVPDVASVVTVLAGTRPLMTGPSLKPNVFAMRPQPIPLARIWRIPWVWYDVCAVAVDPDISPIKTVCNCSAVGSVMF